MSLAGRPSARSLQDRARQVADGCPKCNSEEGRLLRDGGNIGVRCEGCGNIAWILEGDDTKLATEAFNQGIALLETKDPPVVRQGETGLRA